VELVLLGVQQLRRFERRRPNVIKEKRQGMASVIERSNLMDDTQVLNDVAMFLITAIALVWMLAIMFYSIYRHDIDWLWTFAFIVPWAMVTASYGVLWLTPETPTLLFPILATLTRPGVLGIAVVVCAYSGYRTYQKRRRDFK
jgi:Ca2+/Na+ antiporter